MFDIPILLITYKRPASTQKIIDQIKKINPSNIYISSDAPKTDSDYGKCMETRKMFDEKNWDDTVNIFKLFQEKNLGVGLGPKAAIDWFFENNEMGIILEDDILPSVDFFHFCKELLIKYETNDTIMHINAMNFLGSKKVTNDSYYFSRITAPWGWATWRRSWKLYDFNMADLHSYIKKIEIPDFYKKEFINYKKILDNHKNTSELFAWDYQWLYCVLKNQGMSIVPSKNLALNTGFSAEDASNTFSIPNWVKNISLEELKINRHPEKIQINEWADELTFNEIVGGYKLNYFKWITSKFN